jgi:competence ComEA-like helix-hairpin-helix protein
MLKKLLMLFVAFALSMGVAFAAVDVNTADESSLEAVKGLGPVKSKAIIDERTKNGPFKDADDLANRVKGLGTKSVANLEQAGLTIGGSSAPPTGAKPAASKTPAPTATSAAPAKSTVKSTTAATAATSPAATTATTPAVTPDAASATKGKKGSKKAKAADAASSSTTAATADAASGASGAKASKKSKKKKAASDAAAT